MFSLYFDLWKDQSVLAYSLHLWFLLKLHLLQFFSLSMLLKNLRNKSSGLFLFLEHDFFRQIYQEVEELHDFKVLTSVFSEVDFTSIGQVAAIVNLHSLKHFQWMLTIFLSLFLKVMLTSLSSDFEYFESDEVKHPSFKHSLKA